MFNKFRKREIGNSISSEKAHALSPGIVIEPNPITSKYNVHLKNSHSLTQHQPFESFDADGSNESHEERTSKWLKSNFIWFNDAVGGKLLSVLIENGVTHPSRQLRLLKEWPDLIQIAEAANLNIIQRRKFINAAHDPMGNISMDSDYTAKKLKVYRQETMDREYDDTATNVITNRLNHDFDLPLGFFIPGPYYNRYMHHTDRDHLDNEIKHILVMSDKEQEVLARMDSIISQLHITRNLIRRRCQALDTGAIECENIIRKEFNLLRKLLTRREEEIIHELHSNKEERMDELNTIDIEIESALSACHKSKNFVECIVENDTQYSGASWAVLIARRNRAVQHIENCIHNQVTMKYKDKYSISSLIHSDMNIDNLLAFETKGTAQNIGTITLNKGLQRRLSAIDDQTLSFGELLMENIGKLQDIEDGQVGENSYASHELNVFIRSPSQIRLRMCIPGFSFQRKQKRMHDIIRRYGAITDVEASVDSQLNGLFKSVAKIPQHSVSPMDIMIDVAYFVNEITKEFDVVREIYKFDNHRSLHVELTVRPNPDDAVKAAKIVNEGYDDDDNGYYDSYGSPVRIVRIYEVELQISRQPKAIIKRRDSYDSDDSNDNDDLNSIDPTLLDWISLGWEKIKSQRFHKDRYDDEQDKMKKKIDIEFSEDWWKEQRVKLLSKVNLNEWPLRHETRQTDDDDDDHKSVDNIICNDLLIRCRIRDFLRVSITKKDEEKDDDKLMSIRDEILVSQSMYSSLNFMKYKLKLPDVEPQDHYGVLILFSDRSLRFYDLYDNKLVYLSPGVPGDHINLPGFCAGLIPYQKESKRKRKRISDVSDESGNSADSENSHSDTLSIKHILDDESETEYELKPTIIRCGGSLSKKATNFVDLFCIENMIWKRIQENMHCNRVCTQSMIIGGKLVVIGGEVEENKSCIEEYDFELKRWDISVIFMDCFWNHSACPIKASEIFICGGYSMIKHEYLSSAMIYDMMTDSLKNITKMKYDTVCSSAIYFNDSVYVIGGQLMSNVTHQFKSVQIYNLKTNKWINGECLNFDHGWYPCCWIQNLLDYTQKRSKEEKERLKRMSKMSKTSKSIDPKPINTIFVAGNGCNTETNVEYLDPKTKKWMVLSKQIGNINIAQVKSIKNQIFKSRKFTPYSIRDDILDRFDKKDKQNLNKYAIIDEL